MTYDGKKKNWDCPVWAVPIFFYAVVDYFAYDTERVSRITVIFT